MYYVRMEKKVQKTEEKIRSFSAADDAIAHGVHVPRKVKSAAASSLAASIAVSKLRSYNHGLPLESGAARDGGACTLELDRVSRLDY